MRFCLLSSVLVLTLAAVVVAQNDIRRVDFRNFTYNAFCAGEDREEVTVKNGEFSSEKQMDGYVDRFYFKVFQVEYGDLSGDPAQEAVILTVCNTGGTGNFSEGFVYGMQNGQPLLLATIPGGDRAYGGLRKAYVESGILVVESNDVGEMGGACCPEVIVTSKYRVRNGNLTEAAAPVRREIYPKERVKFAPGTSGSTLKVTLPSNEGRRFVVGARAGQTLTASVSSKKAELGLLEDAQLTQNVDGFTARLPKNGDYTIELRNYEDAPITVTLNIRIR